LRFACCVFLGFPAFGNVINLRFLFEQNDEAGQFKAFPSAPQGRDMGKVSRAHTVTGKATA
jgi:hypothetical protein